MKQDSFGIYIHIPYCSSICPYCDFNVYAKKILPEKEYVKALIDELSFALTQKEWKNREVHSIYFGGGTPSIFEAKSINKIINSAHQICSVNKNIEITLEANPEHLLDLNKLEGLKSAGVNRLSLGAQSLNDKILQKLGRKHTPEIVRKAIKNSRKVQINNLNIDLIYAAPTQDLKTLEKDIKDYISLETDHISAYTLTIEQGTPFFQAVKQKTLAVPNNDLQAEMFLMVSEKLEDAKFEHYEVSNFAKKDFKAVHNSSYWECKDYLGLGAGAHSFNKNKRWANIAKPKSYIDKITQTKQARAWTDNLSIEDLEFEFFFLGLRRKEGVEIQKYETRFNKDFVATYSKTINSLKREQVIEINDNNLRLSLKGFLLADSVIESFVQTKP